MSTGENPTGDNPTGKKPTEKSRQEITRIFGDNNMKIAILGSTGSIGTQTLSVAREQNIEIAALSCGANVELLEKQIREFRPEIACVADKSDAEALRIKTSDLSVRIVYGMEGLIECASVESADMVVTAVVGMMGIRPTIAAINAGKDIALANKETLVTAGHIIIPLTKEKGVKIYPVDSEHSAIYQSLSASLGAKLEKILLTASGGPFRKMTREQLEKADVAAALRHPNWNMGRKITIDSASMVNKGLEVIEAKWLFNVEPEDIEVVVHPESIVHSAVQFADGAVIAQLGTPDMKLPIQYALLKGERRNMNTKRVNLFEIGELHFEKPNNDLFKGLPLALSAAKAGGTMPTVFNAANEKAVSLFLKGKIGFTDIYELIEKAMAAHKVTANPDVDTILEAEREAWSVEL